MSSAQKKRERVGSRADKACEKFYEENDLACCMREFMENSANKDHQEEFAYIVCEALHAVTSDSTVLTRDSNFQEIQNKIHGVLLDMNNLRFTYNNSVKKDLSVFTMKYIGHKIDYIDHLRACRVVSGCAADQIAHKTAAEIQIAHKTDALIQQMEDTEIDEKNFEDCYYFYDQGLGYLCLGVPDDPPPSIPDVFTQPIVIPPPPPSPRTLWNRSSQEITPAHDHPTQAPTLIADVEDRTTARDHATQALILNGAAEDHARASVSTISPPMVTTLPRYGDGQSIVFGSGRVRISTCAKQTRPNELQRPFV